MFQPVVQNQVQFEYHSLNPIKKKFLNILSILQIDFMEEFSFCMSKHKSLPSRDLKEMKFLNFMLCIFVGNLEFVAERKSSKFGQTNA